MIAVGKMKTKRSAAKRFKRTGSGRVMHSSPGQNHASTSKNARRMRRLKQMSEPGTRESKRIKELIND